MFGSVRFIIILVLTTLIGVTWIHLPNSHVTFMLVYMPCMLLAGLVLAGFLIALIISVLHKRKFQTIRFIKCIIIVLVFVISPLVSDGIAGAYCKKQAEQWLQEVKEYRAKTGCYPDEKSEIAKRRGLFQLRYYKYSDIDHFKICYEHGPALSVFYDSRWPGWTTDGWND